MPPKKRARKSSGKADVECKEISSFFPSKGGVKRTKGFGADDDKELSPPNAKRRALEDDTTSNTSVQIGAGSGSPLSNEVDTHNGSPLSNEVDTGSGSLQSNEVDNTSLFPEQKERIESKRLEAEAKLWSQKLGSENLGSSWMKILSKEFKKPYFSELQSFVAEERKSRTVYPPAGDVFSWTMACSIDEIKVVILGQDPYHGPNQAHGLCFSVRVGVQPPPSLVNIYKELANCIDGFIIPDHGYLEGWARQGVLLLNACLTVRQKEANSHTGKGWEKLTDAVIHWLNDNQHGIVFMLWGAYAQKKGSFIDKKRHHVLKAVHPSPLSASRGFFGCKHFSVANDLLIQQNKTPIEWGHLPKTFDDN